MSGESMSTKVVIEQAYSDTDIVDTECPWADHIDGNIYQLKNFPFYAYGISYDDVFEALPKYKDDPRPYVTKVIEKSGNHTIRIRFEESIKESKENHSILDRLAEMGCGYEGFDGKYLFVINVQPHCDYNDVCDYLNEVDVAWEHADPPGGEPFSADS